MSRLNIQASDMNAEVNVLSGLISSLSVTNSLNVSCFCHEELLALFCPRDMSF